MALIELRNVLKQFGTLVVLDHVDLNVNEGETLVVIGASGSGKSVMLKHMVALLEPDEGEVWFDGKKLNGLSPRQLIPIRQQFGFVFQMGALFDSMTVYDNIAFPLTEHTHKPAGEIRKIAQNQLEIVGLPDIGEKTPGQLSGGQRKRVALARALAMSPRVILYDEPTTGLDPVRSDVINELILKLKRELRVTSVVVTHDMNSAFKVADRLVMLHRGKFVFDGTVEEIQRSQNPTIRNFVAGEASPLDLERLHRRAV